MKALKKSQITTLLNGAKIRKSLFAFLLGYKWNNNCTIVQMV